MNSEYLRVMSESASDLLARMNGISDPLAIRGMMSLLLTLCRNMEDIAPRNASVDAQERANQLGIGDLRKYHFDDGGRFPGGRKKSGLHWEHWRPAVDLRTDLFNLKDPTPKSVQSVLSTAKVCWILHEENIRLNSLGYRTKRIDPEACYFDAKIVMAYPW